MSCFDHLLTRWPAVVLVLFCGLSLSLFSGCASDKPPDDALTKFLSSTTYPRIAALNGLGREIIFSSPVVRGTGDGQWSIAVPIRLLDNQTQTLGIEYKFEFFNADGSPMTSPKSDWQYMNLPPKTQRYAQGQAKIASAENWRLMLRPAKRQGE